MSIPDDWNRLAASLRESERLRLLAERRAERAEAALRRLVEHVVAWSTVEGAAPFPNALVDALNSARAALSGPGGAKP